MGSTSVIVPMLNFIHRLLCTITRYILIIVYGKRGKSMPPIDDPLLLESATALAQKIRAKKITSTQLINSCIRRIKQINPLLNCVVDERYAEALEEAAEVDKLIASNRYTNDELRELKPFLGIPISTKDGVSVKGMLRTCGLWSRRNERGSEDSDAMQLMRQAGAIPLVVTNVPEIFMWWESNNKIFGRTLNPYDTNRIAGGSNGGEACLQAAGGLPFGLGSDIAGSIRMPTFFNGIFGHLPSPYVVSNEGHWPDLRTREEDFALRIGPISRFACDLTPMLKIMAGDKAKELDIDKSVELTKLKYFYQYDDGGALLISPVDRDIRKGLTKVVQYLENDLKVKPQQIQLDKLKESMPLWMANVIDERVGYFEHKLANLKGQVNPFIELFKWFVGLSKHTFPALLNAIQGRFNVKYGSTEHRSKVRECNELKQEFEDLLGDSGVFIYPTHPTVAPYHNEPIIRGFNFSYTAIFNVLGFPCTTVPLGIGREGLPIGIQVVAIRNQDRLCLAVAEELSRAFGGWIAPENRKQD